MGRVSMKSSGYRECFEKAVSVSYNFLACKN